MGFEGAAAGFLGTVCAFLLVAKVLHESQGAHGSAESAAAAAVAPARLLSAQTDVRRDTGLDLTAYQIDQGEKFVKKKLHVKYLQEKGLPSRCLNNPMDGSGDARNGNGDRSEDQRQQGVVQLDCRGQWGNRITEYVVARIVAEELGWGLYLCPILAGEVVGSGQIFPNLHGIPFNASKMANLPRVSFYGHRYPVQSLVADSTPRVIHLAGFPFRDFSPFRDHKAQIRDDWLKIDLSCVDSWGLQRPNERDVVLHIRAYGDCSTDETALDNGYDPNDQFVDLPSSYFDRILESIRKRPGGFEKLWIVSRCGMRHPTAMYLAKKYGAALAPSVSGREDTSDFLFMQSASTIIMSQSTYAWWAAWLSSAKEVHYPLVGDWWGKKPRHTLFPDEPHYVFHDLVQQRFFLSFQQIGPVSE
jgi:hypothetical protein